MTRGRGWHGESARHAAAARGIPTRTPEQPKVEMNSLLERIRVKMDRLIDATYREENDRLSSRLLTPWIVTLYERNVEDMLVMLESNLKPEDLSIPTLGGNIGGDLARAREWYEQSFNQTSTEEKFVKLEGSRQYIHAIGHALYEEYIL